MPNPKHHANGVTIARITHPQIGRQHAFGPEFFAGFAESDLADDMLLTQALDKHGYVIEELAIVKLPDGTVLGDGMSIVILHTALDLDDVVRRAKSSTSH